MAKINAMQLGEVSGQWHEVVKMLQMGQIDLKLVEFQLGRLTQKSMQGIIGQLPTFHKVRAPGSLEKTLERLRERKGLDPEIPDKVMAHALASCAQVPSGTMLDVVKVELWMLGRDFSDSTTLFKVAKEHGLTADHNSWLPFAIADQFRDPYDGNALFVLKRFGKFKKWSIAASPGSKPTKVRMEWPNHWYLFSGNSYCFVRQSGF